MLGLRVVAGGAQIEGASGTFPRGWRGPWGSSCSDGWYPGFRCRGRGGPAWPPLWGAFGVCADVQRCCRARRSLGLPVGEDVAGVRPGACWCDPLPAFGKAAFWGLVPAGGPEEAELASRLGLAPLGWSVPGVERRWKAEGWSGKDLAVTGSRLPVLVG